MMPGETAASTNLESPIRVLTVSTTFSGVGDALSEVGEARSAAPPDTPLEGFFRCDGFGQRTPLSF